MSIETALFDAPGPRARRRHAILTVIGVVIAIGVLWLVVRKMASANQLESYMWAPFVNDPEVWTEYLLPGLWETLKAAVLSVVLAGIFGIVFGMGRLSHLRAVRWASGAVVEFFRSVPVLLMMIFFFFGWFSRVDWIPNDLAPLAGVVLALTLYNGSVIAELVRSGVHSLPSGQAEAGLSIGLSPGQTLRSIQLPQALTAMLPALVGQLVVVLKDTALGTIILYPELLTSRPDTRIGIREHRSGIHRRRRHLHPHQLRADPSGEVRRAVADEPRATPLDRSPPPRRCLWRDRPSPAECSARRAGSWVAASRRDGSAAPETRLPGRLGVTSRLGPGGVAC